jgi:hypothetical protein
LYHPVRSAYGAFKMAIFSHNSTFLPVTENNMKSLKRALSHNSISILWSKTAFPWKGLLSVHYYSWPGSDSNLLLPPICLSDHLPCCLYNWAISSLCTH